MTWGLVAVGGGSLAGALISSNAASNAADTQAEATGKAVDATNQQYGQTREDLAPYRNAGNQALARLNQLIGIGPQAGNTLTGEDISAIAKTPEMQAFYAKTGVTPDQWIARAQKNFATGDFGNDTAAQLSNINTALGDMGIGKVSYSPQASTASAGSGEYGSLLRDFAPSDLAADPIYKSALDFTTQQGERAINNRRAATGSFDSGAALKELGTFNLGNASALGSDAFSRFNTNRSNKYSMLSGISGTGLSAAGATSSAGTSNASNLANLYTGQGNAAAAAGIAGGNAISGGINNAIGNYNSNNLLAQLSGGGQRAYTPGAFAGPPSPYL